MATYVLPQVLVFQEFERLIAVAANPLRAHISGGHAFLLRYAQEDERDFGELGPYDNQVDANFLWPERPAGAQIDYTYTKLFIRDALLEYYSDDISTGQVIKKTTGYNNRIYSANLNFAKNGTYDRAAVFGSRDVQAGDTVKLRVTPTGGDPVVMWTSVRDILGDKVASSAKAAIVDTNNPITQVQDVAVTQTAGTAGTLTLTVGLGGYKGLESGYVNETYTLICTASSVDGDPTTARLRLLSASGKDDVISFSPAEYDDPQLIGARDFGIVFSAVGVGETNLEAGQTWNIVIAQAFTAPVPTRAGSYNDDNATTYIVEVTKGGAFTDSPEITVSTTNNYDYSAPRAVSAAATAVPIGTKGLTISFAGDGLRLGDKYYVEVVGAYESNMRTIVLTNNIPSTVAAESEVGLTLYIRKPLLEVPVNRLGFAPEVNFEQSETEFTVKSGIIGYDETWVDDDGALLPLDIKSDTGQDFGTMYLEYRAWRSDLAYDVYGIDDVGQLNERISGPLHPDNPLKWGVFKALSNSNGTEVKYTAVAEIDEVESWNTVLELLIGRDSVYGLVPLTRNKTVLDLYAAHVDSMSAPQNGLWRSLWVNLQGIPEIPVIHAGSTVPGYIEATTTDGDTAFGLFEEDPQTSGQQYTILRVPEGNADFIRNKVQPGDIVRGLYTSDGFGGLSYQEYVVDEVQSEEQLRVLTGPEAPQSIPAKFEIWRTLSPTAEAQEIARDAGAWNNRRIRAIWPDRIESGGTIMEGYHLCAALAGLASGILPQQGMTRLEISGFDDVSRTTKKFNRTQLDVMAVAGTWIVTQNIQDGEIFSRHAVTTGDYENINDREEMLTRNVDSISYRYKDHFEPYIGVTNVVASMRDKIEAELRLLADTLRDERFTRELGGQLISATIISFEISPLFKDRYVLRLAIEVPYALNNLEIHLVV